MRIKHKRIWLTACALVFLSLLAWGTISYRNARHRSKMNACMGNLRMIYSMKEQWAMDAGVTNGPVDMQGILRYVKGNSMPSCPADGTYTVGNLGESARCSIHGKSDNRRHPKWWKRIRRIEQGN